MKNKDSVLIRAKSSDVVHSVIYKKVSLDKAIHDAVKKIHGNDVSLFKNICYGTIRFHWELKSKIKRFLKTPIRKRDKIVQILLETAIFQIDRTRIPNHAVVSLTVEAAKKLKKKNHTAFINGILRAYLRSNKKINDIEDESEFNHPIWMIQKIKKDWPDHWKIILESNNEKAPMWLRVNPKKITANKYIDMIASENNVSKSNLGYIGDCKYSVCLKNPIQIDSLPKFYDGYVSIQDGAAQLAVECLLNGKDGRILDACAAPGGKTGQILENIVESSQLTAIEIDPLRAKLIDQNLERLGYKKDILINDLNDIESWWDSEFFDLILLDAPCSSSGVIRRHPDIKHLRKVSDISAYHKKQLKILNSLWSTLSKNGRMIYVTCSLFREENDDVINQFKKKHDNVAHGDLLLNNNIKKQMIKTEYGYQVLPGIMNMDGFYFACLEKKN